MNKEQVFIRELSLIEAVIRRRLDRANSGKHAIEAACLIHELRTIDTIITKFQKIYGIRSNRLFTLNQILRASCKVFDLTQIEISQKRTGGKRTEKINRSKKMQYMMLAKKVMIYCMYNYTASRSAEIGKYLGYKDHTCVTQYKSDITRVIDTDEYIKMSIDKVLEYANGIKDIDQQSMNL